MGGGSLIESSLVDSVSRNAKFQLTGLSSNTSYTCRIVKEGVTVKGFSTGSFRTAPSGNASFTVALSGDALSDSNTVVYDSILASGALWFQHLGDMHYENIATNSPSLYNAAYDVVLNSRFGRMVRGMPTTYVWDDHDYGPNDSDSTHVGRAAAASTYRDRVPSHPLVLSSGAIYYSYIVGRVRFVVTDLRHEASVKSATDNSSKSMMGATQKTWFKAELDAAVSAGQMVVWVCSRTFGGVPTAGADHWGGFTTERREIADYIKANCHGRVVVVSADRHALDIDDGTNHDFATGGGEPIKTFQCAALDQPSQQTYGGATYSQGGIAANGQFGTMEVVDSGGSSLNITWRGFNSSGVQQISYNFSVTV